MNDLLYEYRERGKLLLLFRISSIDGVSLFSFIASIRHIRKVVLHNQIDIIAFGKL